MEILGLDTETHGLNGPLHRIGALTIDEEFIWLGPEDTRKIERYLEEADKIVLHNAKYDAHVLGKVGIELPWEKVQDTLVMACFLLGNEPKDLLSLSVKYLDYDGGLDLRVKDYAKKVGMDYGLIPDSLLSAYTRQQLENTLLLYGMWESEVPWEAYRLEINVVRALYEMERRGVPVSAEILQSAKEEIDKELKRIKDELDREASRCLKKAVQQNLFGEHTTTFNPNSADQIAEVIHAKGLRLPYSRPIKRGTLGKPITSREALLPISHDPFVQNILTYRELNKIRSTYLDNLLAAIDEDGIIHPNFSNTTTRTGRLSCSNPNLQNQAKNPIVKRAFTVRPGFRVVALDFNQLELMLAVFLSGDTNGVRDFEEGIDAHYTTAVEVFGDPNRRADGKQLNFAVIYGMQSPSLAKKMGVSVDEAERYLERFFTYHDGIDYHRRKVLGLAKQTGEIKLSSGRKLYLTSEDHYKAYNWLIQGEAAHVAKMALVKVAEFLRDKPSNILLFIHDEIVVEISEEEDFEEMYLTIGELMCSVSPYPLSVEAKEWVGDWSKTEELVPF